MKFSIYLTLIFAIHSLVVSCAQIAKRQTNVNSIDNVQNLLQELEKANGNIVEISNQVNKHGISKESETPVRDALTRLFSSFQQMASAYVGVLTSVGKSIGLPTIGAGVQYLEGPPQPIIVKQISENIRQFQESVQDVSKQLNNFFTRETTPESNVLMNQMRKFLRLWSNQIQEVSDQVTRSFGGLQSEGSSITIPIPMPIIDFFQNMMRRIEETLTDIRERMNRMWPGGQQPTGLVLREDQEVKPSQIDLFKEFKNLIEIIQKRMKALSQQLDNLITNTTDQQKAEHKSPSKIYF